MLADPAMDHPLRLPKYGAFSFVSKAAGLARGLVSRDPARRLDSGQRLLVYMLWNRPRPEIERHLEFAERINDDALVGSRLWPDRDAMLVAIPKGGAIAEVGVYQGGFSKRIAEVCRPKSLNLIDIDLSALDEAGVRSMLNGATLKTHQGDGAAILSSFADATFDMIYVDADHSYASVAKDIAAAHRALKPGGLMMCNDYTNWCSPSVSPYGVARAVNEFVNREGYDCIGLALHPAGLYDILLRKPAA